MLRIALLLLLLVSATMGLNACGLDPKPEVGCNFVQNSKAQRVSWGYLTPVVLYVDRSVPPEYFGPIEVAIQKWNTAHGRTLLKLGGWIGSSTSPSRDGANVIYWMSTWEADRPYEQARTTVHWAGDRIYEADVRVNAKNFRYSDGPLQGHVDIASLLVHEFGHVLGLTHTEQLGSVMAKSLANNTERRQPTPADVESLKCEY